MEPGDILFVRGRSIWSPFIRYVDNGPFTHVAMAVTDKRIIEAQRFTPVRIMPVYFKEYEVIPMNFSLTERDNLVRVAVSLCGKEYDYTQALSYILHRYFNTPVVNDKNNVICSELIIEILVCLGKIKRTDDVLNLTPNQLYDYLRKEAVS